MTNNRPPLCTVGKPFPHMVASRALVCSFRPEASTCQQACAFLFGNAQQTVAGTLSRKLKITQKMEERDNDSQMVLGKGTFPCLKEQRSRCSLPAPWHRQQGHQPRRRQQLLPRLQGMSWGRRCASTSRTARAITAQKCTVRALAGVSSG